MNWSRLPIPKVLVSIGFLAVGGGNLSLVGISATSPGGDFFLVVSAVGYAGLAFASWVLLSMLSRSANGIPGIRRVLRLFSLASLVLGVAYIGLINEVIRFYRATPHFGFRYLAASVFLPLVGFVVAAVGFLTAARQVLPKSERALSEESSGH